VNGVGGLRATTSTTAWSSSSKRPPNS
jgi:hypothetical protein